MKRYLLLSDFDGTLADTFTASPNNIGVNEAHESAVGSLFGEVGVEIYKKQGGLKNRAASELVADILREKPELLENARRFFERAKKEGLLWDSADPQRTITELLVYAKLERLSGEIGTTFPDGRVWPPPCEGVLAFLKEIKTLNERGDVILDLGVLSAGHTEFIKKTFAAWGISEPAVLVTDEDIRSRDYPKEPFRRVKPGAFPFALAHWKWLRAQGKRLEDFNLRDATEARGRIVYAGDDPARDGEMAKSAGVPFFFFDRNGAKKGNLDNPNSLTIESWNELGPIFEQPGVLKQMQEGKPFGEIFAPIFAELRTRREGDERIGENKVR